MEKTAIPLSRSAAPPAATQAAPQADRRPAAAQQVRSQQAIEGSPRQVAQRQQALGAPAPNRTGLPDQLKAGVEHLSGHALDEVKVHYNSARPAQLQAHAYAQGSDIHLAPGQEKHLPHEAWHVVQQQQGRVRPTMQLQGTGINDDGSLEREADAMASQLAALAGAPAQRQAAPGRAASHATAGVVQRALSDDKNWVSAAKTKMLESQTPLKNQFETYAGYITTYKTHKPDSDFRAKSARGLFHWAEHFNVGAQGSLSELRRVRDQIGYDPGHTLAGTHTDGTRKIRFGLSNTTEPDLVSKTKHGGVAQQRAEEIKGVSTADEGNVGSNLHTALHQLDDPRADAYDFWKAVVYITNAENPWPYMSIAAAAGKSNAEIEAEAKKRINAKKVAGWWRDKYEISVRGINKYNIFGHITNPPGALGVEVHWQLSPKAVDTEMADPVGRTQKATTHTYPSTPVHLTDYGN